jgi:hypothetical protein
MRPCLRPQFFSIPFIKTSFLHERMSPLLGIVSPTGSPTRSPKVRAQDGVREISYIQGILLF